MMQYRLIKKTGALVGGVAAAVLVPMGAAQAALPEGVEAAITGVGTDLAAAGGAVIVAMVSFWGVRKLGSKMGWW